MPTNPPEDGEPTVLLPCPFCGETPGIDNCGAENLFIYCTNDECFVQPETGWFRHAEDAVAKWNTRSASPPVDQGRVERLAAAAQFTHRMLVDQQVARVIRQDLRAGGLADLISTAVNKLRAALTNKDTASAGGE